ncbi:MAG TPA: hypothetical protein VKU19_23970 [Bryobacteraceae bacterium]|nr:hypothetical protein [Bryobacteraceae bacterium]
MSFGWVLELASLCLDLAGKRKEYAKSKVEKFYLRLNEACATPGKEGELLLAKFCEECELRSSKNPNDSQVLYKWGIALWWRASRAPDGQAERLYKQADARFASALAIDSNNGEIYASRVEALRRRALLDPYSPAGHRLLSEICEMCQRRVGIYANGKHDARILWVWALALADLASIDAGTRTEALYREAEERFCHAYRLSPEADFQVDRAQSMLYWSRLHTGETKREKLAQVCEMCQALADCGTGGSRNLVIWGNTLSWQASLADRPEAGRLYAAAEEKFSRALRVDPQDLTAEVGRVRVMALRAFGLAGAERRVELERTSAEFERIEGLGAQDAQFFAEFAATLCWRAVAANGAEAERLFQLTVEKCKRGLAIKPNDDDLLLGLAMTLALQARRCDSPSLLAEAFDRLLPVLDRNPGNGDALKRWASLLSLGAKLQPGEESRRRLAEATPAIQAAAQHGVPTESVETALCTVLWAQADLAQGEERAQLYREVKRKLLDLEAGTPQSAAYSLACLCAQTGEIEECRRWLEASREPGIQYSRDAMEKQEEFAAVRSQDWFQAVLARDDSVHPTAA